MVIKEKVDIRTKKMYNHGIGRKTYLYFDESTLVTVKLKKSSSSLHIVRGFFYKDHPKQV